MTSPMSFSSSFSSGAIFNNGPASTAKNGSKDGAIDDFAGLLASAFGASNQLTTPVDNTDTVADAAPGKGLAENIDDSVLPLDGTRPLATAVTDIPVLMDSGDIFKPASKPLATQAETTLLPPTDGDGSLVINGQPVTPDTTKIQSGTSLTGSDPWNKVLKIAVLPQQFAVPNMGGNFGEQSSQFINPQTTINNPTGPIGNQTGITALQKLIGEIKSTPSTPSIPAPSTPSAPSAPTMINSSNISVATNQRDLSSDLPSQFVAQFNGDIQEQTASKDGIFSNTKTINPPVLANADQALSSAIAPDSAASNFINGLTTSVDSASAKTGITSKDASLNDEVKLHSGAENSSASATIETGGTHKTELQPAQNNVNSGNGISRQLINPIFDTFHKLANQDTKTLQIKLNPENWGEVRLCLTKGVDGRLSADIFAESNAAHQALSSGLADLKQDLVQMGLVIDHLNVSVEVGSQTNHQSKGSYDEETKINYQIESSFANQEPSLSELPQVKKTNNHRLLSLEI